MTGLIILAAGASSRFGEPKQKTTFKGKTLLQRAIEAGLHSTCQPVVVILGAYANEILPDIEKKDLIICHNSQWEEGMASSIRLGIEVLQKSQQSISDVIIMVCDQPFVDTSLLGDLINKKLITGKEIIACSYNNTLGVPLLFDKKFFPELLSLEGQEGAKKLIMKHKEAVADVPFPMGSFDIDTIEDYKALIEFNKLISNKPL